MWNSPPHTYRLGGRRWEWGWEGEGYQCGLKRKGTVYGVREALRRCAEGGGGRGADGAVTLPLVGDLGTVRRGEGAMIPGLCKIGHGGPRRLGAHPVLHKDPTLWSCMGLTSTVVILGFGVWTTRRMPAPPARARPSPSSLSPQHVVRDPLQPTPTQPNPTAAVPAAPTRS